MFWRFDFIVGLWESVKSLCLFDDLLAGSKDLRKKVTDLRREVDHLIIEGAD